jgi:hypothetical protein
MFFLLVFSISAFAEVALKAEVDKKNITTDDSITYKLLITSTQKNIPAVQLPEFEGFKVLSQAQSSSASFIKDKVKTAFVYAYILAPENTGKIIIQPAMIKLNNSKISSESFEIEVKQGKPKPRPKTGQIPGKSPWEAERRQVTL